jgi:hypothetical protein
MLRPVNADRIEITLELRLDGDTVSGRARSAGGEAREFAGWIGLLGMVDSIVEGARNGGPANNHQNPEESTNAD